MQFQVNEETYFLDYLDEERRWFLFKPTRGGIEAVPVVDDDDGLKPFLNEVEVDIDSEVVN